MTKSRANHPSATANPNSHKVTNLTAQTAAANMSTAYLKTVGIVNNGNNGRGFANPYDIAFAPDGRIFVLNRCDPARADAIRVGVCNLDEDYLYEFGNGYGDGDGQFIWPVAMAFDSDGLLHITDEYNNRVSVFSADGDFIRHWGEAGSAPGRMDGPAGIALGADGTLCVADQRNNRVQRFTADGELVAAWGEPGAADGQFNLPWGVGTTPDGGVLVADWRNDRVQKFSADGEHLLTIGESGGGPGQLSRPSGADADANGNIYVADWGNERVQIFDADGAPQAALRGQATLSSWAKDYFAANPDEWSAREIAELEPETLPEHLRTPYHISSQIEPYFWGPVSARLDGEGRLYVVETNRHRFQVYGAV